MTTLIDLDALTDLQVALTPPPPEVVASDDGHWPGQPPPEVWAEARVDQAVRNRLVEAYHPLVVRVTRRMLASLASHADFDDLCSAGVLGLIDAIGRYDPTRSPFVAFAARRIRGAIGDELRSIDYVTRGQRHRTREAEATAEALAHRLHRTPTPAELAAAGANYRVDPPVRLGSMRKGLDDEDPWGEPTDPGLTPEELVTAAAERETVRAAVQTLTPRQRLIIELRFWGGVPRREIGALLGITESRVSQIMHAALDRIVFELGRRERLDLARSRAAVG